MPADCEPLGQGRLLLVVSAAHQEGGSRSLHCDQHKGQTAVQQVEDVQSDRDNGKKRSSVSPEEAVEIGIERRHRRKAE